MPADIKPVVGFIGLGRMGGKMARNIASGGFTLVAYDLDAEALAAAVEAGAAAAESAADAVARGDIVMTSLPSSAVTVKVTEKELLPRARAGQAFLDMGTTEAPQTRRLAAAFEAKGAAFLDSPVSGPPGPGMRVFVGGDRAAFERCRPVLESTADPERIVYCGGSGTGQAVKATNQLGMGLANAALIEAVFAGVRAGADVDAIIQGVGGDSGFRKRLAEVAERVKTGKANDLFVKFPEFPYFLAEARDRGYELPLTKALRAFLEDGPRDWVDNMERPRVAFWHQLMEAKQGVTSTFEKLYRPSMALLTDMYQLTMASAYRRSGMADREAAFQLFYRQNPFGGGYALLCGVEEAVSYATRLSFDEADVSYLRSLAAADGSRLFDDDFLAYLAGLEMSCDIDAVPEGTVVFPHEPLVRVAGPVVQCQLLETALLNLVNFPTLVATKASRVVTAAGGDPVLEFGLRRAQGPDGGLSASRAAYVGGCAGTSNVLAGQVHGIPVKGTHAHSWVMCFEDELEAFMAYAKAMPNNAVFLVDTYDTIEGVKNAISAGEWLRDNGRELAGVRLDSGDLEALSAEARRLLDEAGFTDAAVIASNDLDEESIARLKGGGAAIGVWGVGTRLATAYDEPALGGVYKLSAVRAPGGEWQPRAKLSDQPAKSTVGGVLQVRRYSDGSKLAADVIYDVASPPQARCIAVDARDRETRHVLGPELPSEDLLEPVVRAGRRVAEARALAKIRARAASQLATLPDDVRRLRDPARHPVCYDEAVHGRAVRLAAEARGRSNG